MPVSHIITYIISFVTVFCYTGFCKMNRSNRLFTNKGLPAKNCALLLNLHTTGIFWFGIIPIILFNRCLGELFSGNKSPGGLWSLLFIIAAALIILAGLYAGRQILIKCERRENPFQSFFGLYFIIRGLFLCSYEFFFRGILLFDYEKWLGIIPAIIICTLLTVLIHAFTDKKEMWACIPFGIILSCFCISIHAVWPAILLHLLLSMAYEVPPARHFFIKLKPMQ